MCFIGFECFRLTLYWGPEAEVWELSRVLLVLHMLSVVDLGYEPYLIGSAEGPYSDVIFVSFDAGIFMINLKPERAKKVPERGEFDVIFPYMSFCPPVRRRGVTTRGAGYHGSYGHVFCGSRGWSCTHCVWRRSRLTVMS